MVVADLRPLGRRGAAVTGWLEHVRGDSLLALGAALGVAFAGWELAGAPRPLAEGVVAEVEGVDITADALARALDAAAGDARAGLSREDEARVLARLVDQELLLQHALALELPRRDPRLRNEIVTTLVAAILDEAASEEPGEAELAAHLEAHRERFAAAPRVRVVQVFVAVGPGADVAAAEARAREVMARAGDAAGLAKFASLGDPPPLPLPQGLARAEELVAALGPTAARAALELPVGAVSGPVRSGFGVHVLGVTERSERAEVELAEVRAAVRADWIRRRGEARLAEVVAGLREAAWIRERGR